ncbi:MAG: PVC-type heme-binding CxxCH protein, partial [Verrucomicrobiota bacterium]
LGAAVAALALTLQTARAEFDFKQDDIVCLIGNSLADRMQHDGWMETLIQSQTADKKLSFRNLGFCGDRVAHRPRNVNFLSPEKYLTHCKADVIFVFFGYNESFDGEGGIGKFKDQMSAMIDNYRGAKFNGESEPRFVLFTPIAHENHNDPNLPDGKANNERLAQYSEAIEDVAKAKNVSFVDIFSPTLELYKKAKSPLTLNGVHMSKEGNRQLAEVIAKALLGKEVKADTGLAKLNGAVVDKSWHWYNRYRATDGHDVWGKRAFLKFVDGQNNYIVLQRELEMLDVMTANRDERIWAVAKGGDLTVDDSNTPEPIPVESNVGGKSRSSNATKEGSLTYIKGNEGVEKMKLADGFEANVFASHEMFPELVNPVQMSVDTKGRLWVAAWKTYPKWEPKKVMDDRLLILPDEDRDGVADKAITFAKVHNPTGFEFWNGGVIVVSAPDILFLKDTDGDDKADVQVHLMQGIDSADTHHAANNLIYGPDGAIYYQRGVFHVSNVETPWGPPSESKASAMYRFDPRRYTFGFHANNSPNPHGIDFDYWGYHYASDGTGGRCYQVVQKDRGFKMRPLLKKRVRPVASSGIISSQQFPPESQGNFVLCNTIGFLGMKQYKLDRNGDTGEVNGTEVEDLLVSDDRNFRPTDFEFGSDGAMYVSDWQNVIVGHMQHNIRDPNRDHDHGYVYRVTAKGRPLQEHVAVHGRPIEELLDVLKHPVNDIRRRARIELSAHETEKVIAACQTWLKPFDINKDDEVHHMLEGLWLHQQHNVKNPDLLSRLLSAPNEHARAAARLVQHHWYTVDHTRGGAEMAGAEDDEPKLAIGKSDPSKGLFYITTVREQMRYDVKDIKVKAGSEVKIVFSNVDYMPHNLLITEPGAAQEVAMAAMALGAKGFDVEFRPDHPKILWGTGMLDNNKQETLSFTAPTKPGKYEFVCTFPGHWSLMRGIMHVTKK